MPSAEITAAIILLTPASTIAQYKTEFADTAVLNSVSLSYSPSRDGILVLANGNLNAPGTAIDVGDRIDTMIDSCNFVQRMRQVMGPDVVSDCRNHRILRLASGVYLYYVSGGGSSVSGKPALIR